MSCFCLVNAYQNSFLLNVIGAYVDICQHAVFMLLTVIVNMPFFICFSMLMRGNVFKYVFLLLVVYGLVRFIDLTAQTILSAARSIYCTVNLTVIKHYNFESKTQGMLPSQEIILVCLALS